jgi:hypothetical protein
VLDHDERVTGINESLKYADESLDVSSVEAGGGLVNQNEGVGSGTTPTG